MNELRFAHVNEALQHLANVSGQRVLIAQDLPGNRAGCVVYDGERYLLLVTPDGYEFPVGHLQENETAEEAAVRETNEETGFRCRLVHRLGVVRDTRSTTSFFLATPHLEIRERRVPYEGNEVRDIVWRSYEKARQYVVQEHLSVLDEAQRVVSQTGDEPERETAALYPGPYGDMSPRSALPT